MKTLQEVMEDEFAGMNEGDLIEFYSDSLDSEHGPAIVCGRPYHAGDTLKVVDPVAFYLNFNSFVEKGYTAIADRFYTNEDVKQAIIIMAKD